MLVVDDSKTITDLAPWCNWLTHMPVTHKSRGSSPRGVAQHWHIVVGTHSYGKERGTPIPGRVDRNAKFVRTVT